MLFVADQRGDGVRREHHAAANGATTASSLRNDPRQGLRQMLANGRDLCEDRQGSAINECARCVGRLHGKVKSHTKLRKRCRAVKPSD